MIEDRDDEQLMALAAAAVELDDLDTLVTGRSSLREQMVRIRGSSRRRWILGTTAAVAASVLVVAMIPPRLAVKQLAVSKLATRDDHPSLQILVEMNRPAFLRFILVDKRHERWLMPFNDAQSEYVTRLVGQATFETDSFPHPGDSRGPAQAILVILMAAIHSAPTADELLAAFPEPIAKHGTRDDDFMEEIDRIKADLERRFDCVIEVARVDGD